MTSQQVDVKVWHVLNFYDWQCHVEGPVLRSSSTGMYFS